MRLPYLSLLAQLFIAALLACTSPARAASPADDDHPALPCRPTVSCTADLARPGSVEIESGYLFQKLSAPTVAHENPILVKLTLANWAQLQVGGNGATLTSSPAAHYLDNLIAGFKFHIFDERKWAPSVSWAVAAGIPLAAAAGYLRAYDLFLTAFASKSFAWLHVDLNVGLSVWQLEARPKLQPWLALALSVGLPRHFGVALESYYFQDAGPFAARDSGLRAALSFAPRPWIVLDVGADAGYFQTQRACSAFAGMSVLPFTLWR